MKKERKNVHFIGKDDDCFNCADNNDDDNDWFNESSKVISKKSDHFIRNAPKNLIITRKKANLGAKSWDSGHSLRIILK